MIGAWLALACGAPAPRTVPREDGGVVALRELAFAELDVPPDSRGGNPPADQVAVDGPWRSRGVNAAGRQRWAAALPVRPRGLFFHTPEPGMRLLDENGAEIPYDLAGGREGVTWSHDRDDLTVSMPAGAPAPAVVSLVWPTAAARERALNLSWSGRSPEAFAWTSVLDGWDTRRGLLLPAPGRAAWDVAVPPAADLRFAAGIVAPELADGPASDGARLVLRIDGEPVATFDLAPGPMADRRVDLSRWAGRTVRLAVATEPGPGSRADYVFLAAPTVATRVADPRRVVLVFVDTLRRDRLTQYGHPRDTSAALDTFARESVVFDRARSVAPWTLPAARSVVTGRHPEYYAAADTLPAILGRAGFASAFFAGNVYLSASFGMDRDWDRHHVAMLPLASETTDEALAWIAANADRDALLQVHYMSTHLPYLEPPSYRTRYAGEAPPRLAGEITLEEVRSAELGRNPAGQRYLRDRYDGAVRYTTDEIGRLLAALSPRDVVVLFSDHGEEFWDHGGFEHGHTLYEELLAVPLMIRAPGLPPGRVADPVSLLDVTPTILELVGVPAPATDGRSLVPRMRGEPLAPRPLAAGHPLYGADRWGVWLGDQKWTVHEGRERVVDLASDPDERRPLPDPPARFHPALAEAVGRPVGSGWRLAVGADTGPGPAPGTRATCRAPGGIRAAFPADDPLARSHATARVGAAAAEICWSPGWAGGREVYVIPTEPGSPLSCEVSVAGSRATLTPERAEVDLGRRAVRLGRGVTPIPDAHTAPVEGADAEVAGMLLALGYATGEAPPSGSLPCE